MPAKADYTAHIYSDDDSVSTKTKVGMQNTFQ